MFDARFAPFLDMAVLARAAAGRLREKKRQARDRHLREDSASFERRQRLALDLSTKKQRTARELLELCAAYRQAWAPRAGEETVGSGPAERVDSSPAPGTRSPGIFLLSPARAGSFVDRSGRQFTLEASDE
ncbi:MAG: hypothetical protein JXA37_11395 [Chloroflexia bacterium]|nr:hypothetical protein [Chloroflexia bacterium]